MNLSRRDFLIGGSAFAAALPVRADFGGAVRARPALQMYSVGRLVREMEKGGFATVFREIAALGYKGVELAGYTDYGQKGRTTTEMKKMLDDAGLVVVGAHACDLSPERIGRTMEANANLGNKLLIVASGICIPPKEFVGRIGDWVRNRAEFFAVAAETAKRNGFKVGYHNHVQEFSMKDEHGMSLWELFFNSTSPDVCMELDVGWCATAGEDPVAWLKRYPRRSPTIHAKEHAAAASGIFGEMPPGKKGVDWDALFKATDENGTEWYVVETESRQRKSLIPSLGCIEFLKSKGRA